MKKLKSWKTTAAGAAIAIIFLLQYTHVITQQLAYDITTALTTAGLLSAKDSNVTGGSIQQ